MKRAMFDGCLREPVSGGRWALSVLIDKVLNQQVVGRYPLDAVFVGEAGRRLYHKVTVSFVKLGAMNLTYCFV